MSTPSNIWRCHALAAGLGLGRRDVTPTRRVCLATGQGGTPGAARVASSRPARSAVRGVLMTEGTLSELTLIWAKTSCCHSLSVALRL